MNTWLFFEFIHSFIKSCKNSIGDKLFVWVRILFINLIRMYHHYSLTMKLFNCVIVLDFIHAYNIPGVALPQHILQGAK